MIKGLKDQGLSISEISRRLGISRTTVRIYLKSGKVPQYHRYPVGSMISSFLPFVRDLIDRHNLSAVRIYEELRKNGFQGSYSLVKQCGRPMRNDRKTLPVYRYETDPVKQSQVDFGGVRIPRNQLENEEAVCISHDPKIFQNAICRIHHGQIHGECYSNASECILLLWQVH